MNSSEKRKWLHELIDRLDDKQVSKVIQLIRGILGKAF